MYASMKAVLDKMSNLSGDDFRALRKRMGISQAEFASLLDVDIKTVTRIERGHSRVSARMSFAVHFLGNVYESVRSEKVIQEYEKKERERQRMLRELESLASKERKQHGASRPTDPRLTHGAGKRKKKKKR